MSELNTSNETWQVDVNGQVYEANFAELADWIADGSLQPQDLVRRGNLRWIEAQKVPKLTPFFNAKANGDPPPVVDVTITDAAEHSPTFAHPSGPINEQTVESRANPETSRLSAEPYSYQPQSTTGFDPNQCVDHPERPAKFVCLTCSRPACAECVQRFGSSVAICSACGGMCKAKAELESIRQKDEIRSAAITAGFGLGDFAEAISYPFRFKTSLLFGALMFAFFSLGRGAFSLGGSYMIVAAIFSYMLANMLAFGILSNTIDNFSKGKIGTNFMPDFEDFSLWDDVIHPFFLSIGVYISSFGPFIAVFLLGAYLVMSSVSSQLDSMKTNLEQTPGTPFYSARDTMDQSEQVKKVIENTKRINQEHLDALEKIENGQQPATVDQSEQKVQEVNKVIADSQRKELESVVGKSAETRDKESSAFFSHLFRLAAPLVVIGFIAFLWGLFFFPAACIVAGYTRSFTATVNPMVGLDTIKRLGLDYLKILLMGLVLLAAFTVVSIILSLALVAFNMPGVGNLPERAVESVIWFYLVIVFACLLGYAIFKASDRLHLYT